MNTEWLGIERAQRNSSHDWRIQISIYVCMHLHNTVNKMLQCYLNIYNISVTSQRGFIPPQITSNMILFWLFVTLTTKQSNFGHIVYLWRTATGDRWISVTKGQYFLNSFLVITSRESTIYNSGCYYTPNHVRRMFVEYMVSNHYYGEASDNINLWKYVQWQLK